ncbi:protein of unknown function DUF4408 [Macleaya cordata]|uniref:DUF4408 domain-containing protein n=1 Tax=Macleaya cordata TaxID=56857 RepID=A0A200QGF7_MACCD|nr:protein of unknown function DUF4408 [Macleaya cordata]
MNFPFMSLSNFTTFISNPKCLFIMCNIIIVFLLRELKIYSLKSVPATEIYDEYIKRNSSIPRLPSLEDIKECKELTFLEYFPLMGEGVKGVIEVVREEVKEEEEERGGQGRGEEEIMEREEDFHVVQKCSVPNLICTLKYEVDYDNVILHDPINNVDVYDVNDIP